MEQRLRSRLKQTNDSWRVDETYIRVKGKWVYLYRVVDSSGATIYFLLSAKRDTVAAKRFLAKALGGANHRTSGHQHRQARRLSAGGCATQSRGCFGGELPTSPSAVS
jgi:transposase-like protein